MHSVMSRTGVVVVVVVLAMVTMMACSVHGNELDDMLYDDLASKPCVRLMTATGSVGCASTSLCCRGVCFCVCVCVRACVGLYNFSHLVQRPMAGSEPPACCFW